LNSSDILAIGLKLLAVVALVLLNGFFVAAEFALVKVRDTQLDPLIAKGRRQAKLARSIINHLDAFLSAAQLGITLTSLGLGWVGEPVFSALLAPVLGWFKVEPQMQHWIAFAVGFSTITFLHIVAGEQAPKWLAIQKPLAATLWVAYPLFWFSRISFPFIWVLNQSALWLLRRLGLETHSETELPHSEEELRLLFATAQQKAGGSKLGRDIVLNALDLRHRIARDVMRPRHEIVGFNTDASLTECLDLAERTRYSRFPLCDGGDLDKTLGVVHIKDLYALRLKVRSARELLPAARKLVYVPETARLEKLLQLLLERKLHLAIVVDEYGGTAGMVTLENTLEELVGQIQDEFDQEKPLLTRVREDQWDLDGALPLHELSELVGESLSAEGITTVSGYITFRLEGFPHEGEGLRLGTYDLRVVAMTGMRVARLTLTRRVEPGGAPQTELA
jgi:CBS domain containing-hemolysin-like protein